MANKYKRIMDRLGGLDFPSSVKPVNSEVLDEIEIRLGHTLPSDYREFLLDYGDCSFLDIPSVVFPMMRDGVKNSQSISMFYGASYQEADIAERHRLAIENAIVEVSLYPGLSLFRSIGSEIEISWPDELLAIACDGGGNQICVALFGFVPGAIFFWVNAPGDDEQNVYLIANSFDDFMHMLYRGT